MLKIISGFISIVLSFSILQIAFASGDVAQTANALSMQQLAGSIAQYPGAVKINASNLLLQKINFIRANEDACLTMFRNLAKIDQGGKLIQPALKRYHIPIDFLVLPWVESKYENLPESMNAAKTSGLWQLTPKTAKKYGLVITGQRDDRLDTKLSTDVAMNYLSDLYKEFKDWNLVLIAYTLGAEKTEALINKAGTNNVDKLLASPYATDELRDYMNDIYLMLVLMRDSGLLQ